MTQPDAAFTPPRRRPRQLHELQQWLAQQPSLAELRAVFPEEWEAVDAELTPLVERGNLEEIKAYVGKLSDRASIAAPAARLRERRDAAVSATVRRHMAITALRSVLRGAASGASSGKQRFNLINGYLAQRLLFEHALVRKPVSTFWFRLLWPLLWQRRLLMPLVEREGIYCFYSRRFVRELAGIIGARCTLEIAAGDGTLSRFLAAADVRIVATDDYSWSNSIDFPDTVVRQDARQALRTRQPAVVICSWPPPGNAFEREVFRTPSVELYVVIASVHRFAAGDWRAYAEQTDFTFEHDEKLSRLILPPELEPAVYVFRRTERAGGGR